MWGLVFHELQSESYGAYQKLAAIMNLMSDLPDEEDPTDQPADPTDPTDPTAQPSLHGWNMDAALDAEEQTHHAISEQLSKETV